ncbi:MAG TPA: hypothetical protein VF192_01180 [Longimicrobiales bacterium]
MILEVTAQMYDEDRGVMWAYHHKEVVVPAAPDGPTPEDMEACIVRAQHQAASKMLEHIDNAKDAIAEQVANTASITRQFGGD